MCGFRVDGSVSPAVVQVQIFIYPKKFGILPVLPFKSPCPVHSVLYRVLDYLCELFFVVQVAAAKNVAFNGSVAIEDDTGVASTGSCNGAAGAV